MYDDVYGYTEVKVASGDTAIIPIEIPSGNGIFSDNTITFTVHNETSSCNIIEDVPVSSENLSLPQSFTNDMNGRYLISFKITNNQSGNVATTGTRLIVNRI